MTASEGVGWRKEKIDAPPLFSPSTLASLACSTIFETKKPTTTSVYRIQHRVFKAPKQTRA